MSRVKLDARAKALAQRADGVALTINKWCRSHGFAESQATERGLTGTEATAVIGAVNKQLDDQIARITKRMQSRLGGTVTPDKADIYGEPEAKELEVFGETVV